MANLKVTLKNNSGDVLNARTLAELVTNANGDTLEDVEAGAEVNRISTIKVNGSAQTIVNKEVNLDTYTKNDIDTALGGKQNTIDSSHKLGADLVDDSTSTNKFVTASDKTTWSGKQDAISDLSEIRSNASDGAAAKTAVDAMGDIVSHDADEFAEASHTHTSSEITDLSTTIATAISGKADSATTLAGYGITDAYTKTQVDAKLTSTYKAAGSAATVSALGTLDAAHEGYVYNMTAQFTTTSDFVEGSGKKHPAGTNVAIVNTAAANETPVYKYDVMAGFVDTSDYDTHIADTDIHVTTSDKSTWSGKQDALSASNKLDPAYIDTDASNRFVTDTEKSTWSGKQDAITGAATSIVSSDLTASKAMVSDANGKVAVSSVTSTELGYLSGVTSAIQTQINGKADSATTLAGYGIVDGVTYEVIDED